MENNYNNGENIFGNNENGNSQMNDTDNTGNHVPSSTGASGSIYSYSYVNQENQERNPNYYERQEENKRAEKPYDRKL